MASEEIHVKEISVAAFDRRSMPSLSSQKDSPQTSVPTEQKYHSIWKYPLPLIHLSGNDTDTDTDANSNANDHDDDINSTYSYRQVISLITMGPSAANSTLLERCISSIRLRGRFMGPIFVITESIDRYSILTREDPFVFLYSPTVPVIQNHSSSSFSSSYISSFEHFKRDMPYKRYKTYLLEFWHDQITKRMPQSIATNMSSRRLHKAALINKSLQQHVEYMYYLDVDVVVGNVLQPWFDFVEETYLKRRTTMTTKDMMMNDKSGGDIAFFRGNFDHFPLQGGQFVVRTLNYDESFSNNAILNQQQQQNHTRSEDCLLQWRQTIDSNPKQDKDQVALKSIWDTQKQERQNTGLCHWIGMSQSPYLIFLTTAKQMKDLTDASYLTRTQASSGVTSPYPTLMHIKNTQHAKTIPQSVQTAFYIELLELNQRTNNEEKSNIDPAVLLGKTQQKIRPDKSWSQSYLSLPYKQNPNTS